MKLFTNMVWSIAPDLGPILAEIDKTVSRLNRVAEYKSKEFTELKASALLLQEKADESMEEGARAARVSRKLKDLVE